MKLPLVDANGKELKKIDVADEVFGIEPNRAVLHQVYVAQMNARRTGVANTKSRGEVRGSSAKVRRQKGLGRARIGTIRSPVLTGGGVAFGPHTRSYSQAIPKRMKRLAIRSALSSKARDGELLVVDAMPGSPNTSAMAGMLKGIGSQRSTLLVTAEPDSAVRLSARNLEGTGVIPANHLNVADILNHQSLVMTPEAISRAEALWGGERANSRRAPVPVTIEQTESQEAVRQPARRRPAAASVAPESQADAETAVAEKPKPRRRTRKTEAGES